MLLKFSYQRGTTRVKIEYIGAASLACRWNLN